MSHGGDIILPGSRGGREKASLAGLREQREGNRRQGPTGPGHHYKDFALTPRDQGAGAGFEPRSNMI